MRGKVSFGVVEDILDRITPAYAGKSYRIQLILHMLRDHPRLCGEKCPKLTKTKEVTGSPPPMRGKVAMLAKLIGKKGITPAYAGKRFW